MSANKKTQRTVTHLALDVAKRDLDTLTTKTIQWRSILRGSVPHALVPYRGLPKTGTILHEPLEPCGVAP